MIYFVRQERFGVSKVVYKILNSANRPTLLKTKSEKFTLFDIVNALSQVSQATQWGEELKKIQDSYFNQIVMAQSKKKSSIIEPEFFNKIKTPEQNFKVEWWTLYFSELITVSIDFEK